VRLVLAVGSYAQRWHLGSMTGKSLSETVANWREIVASTDPVVVPLPHPSWRNNAWLKKHPWFEAELLPFLRAEIARRLADP
jgi:uracil-DNA glycosylase